MHRLVTVPLGFAALVLMSACGSGSPAGGPHDSAKPGAVPKLTANAQYCAQNRDPKCATGSFHGTNVHLAPSDGYWDANGKPVNGGPMGANGSTGNDLTQEYCARNQDPGCPVGSYVAPDAIKNPDGSSTYVVCEGTICTNPNHGAANSGGFWDANGNPIDGGPMGADGSTGNNRTQEYCARNQDPGCPVGSYVAPDAIKNPDGSPGYVVCEGTICTNPNHGAADPDSGVDTAGPDDEPANDTPTPDTDPDEGFPDDAPTPEAPAFPEPSDDGDAWDPGPIVDSDDEPSFDEP
ncbi:mesocentin [Mycolicibacterium chitae]|uniref:Mesocentin n=2 Tax=Mycobacteriaceae TaxID=1762 RepID=A0A3S4TH98_MYCCI|nr:MULTISPECIES: mesocentin [Mycolicibacterium]MCV7106408.1 mesocentin [Mycolicibacterium chitae]BBZ02227.1 mesocentin [Mycolicibacterium chitae]CAJ1578627.1 mesocentin [Mycolicibacterium sp. MU0050]VEG44397.1 mesocentin [Mycolicibacterium chitae]